MVSQFPAEGAVLERGKEGVQLGQRGALRGLQLLHRSDSTGKLALQLDGWERNLKRSQSLKVHVGTSSFRSLGNKYGPPEAKYPLNVFCRCFGCVSLNTYNTIRTIDLFFQNGGNAQCFAHNRDP